MLLSRVSFFAGLLLLQAIRYAQYFFISGLYSVASRPFFGVVSALRPDCRGRAWLGVDSSGFFGVASASSFPVANRTADRPCLLIREITWSKSVSFETMTKCVCFGSYFNKAPAKKEIPKSAAFFPTLSIFITLSLLEDNALLRRTSKSRGIFTPVCA